MRWQSWQMPWYSTSAIWMVIGLAFSSQLRRQARRVADGAFDVLHPAAADADGVVVVVAHPRLVQGGGVRGLEAAQHLQVGQVAQDHVDGLRGQLGQILAGGGEDVLGGGMRVVFDGGRARPAAVWSPGGRGHAGRQPMLRWVPVESVMPPFKHLL